LRDFVFNVRLGLALPKAFGTLSSINSSILKDARDRVLSIPNPNSELSRLARKTIFTAHRLAAFHNPTNPNPNFTRFSDGTFVFPDNTDNLATFTKITQSQVRFAAVYHRVHLWAQSAQNGVYDSSAQAVQEDIDLDCENGFILMNRHISAYFERMGRRMIAS
jgi:hypothetical protein